MNYKILFLLLLPLAIASCSQKGKQETSKQKVAKVDQEVAQVMADFEAIGVSYVVVRIMRSSTGKPRAGKTEKQRRR
jgi:hypothetical protein